MKNYYNFILALFVGAQTFAQVSVGSERTANYDAGPVNAYYTYSYYQTIYKASDISASGQITSIEYEMVNSNPINYSDDNIDIWMGHTNKTKFDNSKDWIDISTLTKVLTNGRLVKTGNKVKIELDTPFEYNGVENLIIAIDANEQMSDSSSDQFYCSRAENDDRVNLYYRDDLINPIPQNPSDLTGTYTTYFYPNIILYGINQSCPKPSDLSAPNTTGTTADLAWTENGSANSWTIEYGRPGFVQGEGETITVDTNQYTLKGLTPSSKYEFYVKSNCADDEKSRYAGPFSFFTQCETISTNYEADLSVYPPSCWRMASGAMGEEIQFGSSRWRDKRAFTDENNEEVSSNAVNLWSNIVKSWLISNNFDLSAGNFSLETIVAVTDYLREGTSGQIDTDEMGEDDRVYLLISTNNGTTWTNLAEWNATNQPAATGTKLNVDLSNYTGVVKFAFYATDGNMKDPKDYDFHIGKFKITSTENLAVNEIKDNKAKYEFYPNPVNDILIIKGQHKIGKVSIYDATGKLVYQNSFGRDTANINTQNLDKGYYVVNAEIDGVMQNFKVIKK